MPPRKLRIPVVLDTNVLIGYYLTRSPRSTNAAVYKLWRDRRLLQMIVCDELVNEYFEILGRLSVGPGLVARFQERLAKRETVTHVNLGRRYVVSRDVDDNLLLSLAAVGRADYLITNDHDLLSIPQESRLVFRFLIVTPGAFLLQCREQP